MTEQNRDKQPPYRPGHRNPDGGLTDLIHHDRAISRPVAGRLNIGETGIEAYSIESWDVEEGTDVLCSQGEKIGEVVDVTERYLVVERGFFNPHDIYIPKNMIYSHDDSGLHLNMPKDEVEQQHWAQEPEIAPSEPDAEPSET